MRIPRAERYALGVCAAAMVAGCGAGSSAPLGPPAMTKAEQTHVRPAYGIIYSFKFADGSGPMGSLIDANGTMYGTTVNGGANNGGTVFTITPSGVETVLHSFGGPEDGLYPKGGVIDVNGTLYGTTAEGGTGSCYSASSSLVGCGTVFSIAASGVETVVHSFGGSGDGRYPEAGLINVKGTLYGTTSAGGTGPCSTGSYHRGCGTVFSIAASGAETVLHSFDSSDGATPSASLIDVNGNLYGTTASGGAEDSGTAFAITPSGKETVLYSFDSQAGDGASPKAALINVKGTFYGTTYYGGAYGRGTAFAITRSGKETVLHNFGKKREGKYPAAGLIDVNGTLYGTTSDGGPGKDCGKYGCGTVFSLTTSDTERVLHAFQGESDGANPRAGLLDVNGTLYGTTTEGGAHNDGTFFSLSPP